MKTSNSKFDVRAWRLKNKEKIAAYNSQWRKDHPNASRIRYKRRRKQQSEYEKARRLLHPEMFKARNTLNNAIRDGKLERLACEVCGASRSQAHHEDYAKPLEVRWLCQIHHAQIHLQQKVV